MKIILNEKEVREEELGEMLEKLTHEKQYYSSAYLQKVWCVCQRCRKSQELNTPLSALDFVAIHKKDCGESAVMDITISKNVVLAK